jgi:hypothetical protein
MKETVICEMRSGRPVSTESKELMKNHKIEFEQQCPFKPQINGSVAGNRDLDRLKYLARDRSQVYSQRQQLKVDQDVKDVINHCSFHPNINTKTSFQRPRSVTDR